MDPAERLFQLIHLAEVSQDKVCLYKRPCRSLHLHGTPISCRL